jgi:hypothetical protein
MHPLIPDDFSLRAAADNHEIASHTFPEIAGTHTHEVLDAVPMADLLYSFATEHPGAIVLHNFPKHLQHFSKPDGSAYVTGEVWRQPGAGRSRYNEFRRWSPRAGPPVRGLQRRSSVVADLRGLYDDPDDVDLMIGLYAEASRGVRPATPPSGCYPMASRRLKATASLPTMPSGLQRGWLDRRQHHGDRSGRNPPELLLGSKG